MNNGIRVKVRARLIGKQRKNNGGKPLLAMLDNSLYMCTHAQTIPSLRRSRTSTLVDAIPCYDVQLHFFIQCKLLDIQY